MSDNDAGTGVPLVQESLTCYLDNGFGPAANQTVKFECANPSLLAVVGGSWPVTTTTNSSGQARVIVQGTGSGGGTNVNVTCKWLRSDGSVKMSATLSVSLFHETQVTSSTPANKNPYNNPCSIRYSDATTWMSSYTSQARTDFTNTGRVKFVSSGDPQITHDEYCSSTDGYNAYTEYDVDPAVQRKIYFNKWNMNGDPGDINCSSKYAPIGWRHYPRSTANHELGHALVFGHNTASRYSLMWSNPERYFVWKVETMTSNDTGTFNTNYPNTCSP